MVEHLKNGVFSVRICWNTENGVLVQMNEYVIALDAMGGDNAPDAIVRGAVSALRSMPDIRILLAGPQERLEGLLADANDVRGRIEILNAAQVIEMDESPMLAVRTKRDSSLVAAMNAVREKRAGAVVSAGSTGAVLAGGMFKIGRIPGVERPAIAPVFPGVQKDVLLLDAGANVDCQSRYLLQFGLMGAAYMKGVKRVQNPKVGLVNIGTEAEKGNKLVKETFALMEKQTAYRFGGNLEARDIMTGDFDVAVADGFAGNLILKNTEGIAKALFTILKTELMASLPSRIGAMLAKPAVRRVKNRMDYNQVGGAPLLGVEGAVIKAHGSSGDAAIANAIAQARGMLEGDVVGKIREGLKAIENMQTEN